ncbi:hypothetical protein [Oricola cellulosilytica]|uniref:Uncharacterized protein n=1 Tax=Oricola cellulosilytica TaxID=1429082 RepID=A0A4R0PCE8_9HYPH|nr:hypothetical protein [Oricola cellulosilytica]TCD15141.1 hypothetical protein E0D97_06220 [Oricola cellulosilytica]
MTETPLPLNDRFVDLSPAAGTTVLAYDFELTAEAGLKVTRIRAGVRETLVNGVDYVFPTGIGDASGGSVQLGVSSLAGDRYILFGDIEPARLSDFLASRAFDTAKINADLDVLTIIAQEQRRDIERSWKSDYGSSGKNILAGLPETVAKFDEVGNLVEGPSAGEIENAQTYAAQALSSKTDAETAKVAADAARDQALAAVPNAFPLTRSSMKGLPWATTTTAAYLLEPGREGQFAKDNTDLSAVLTGPSILSTAVDPATDTVTSAGHGRRLGQACYVTAAVNGLTPNRLYWFIVVDANNFKLADNFADAFAGTPIDLTGTTNFTAYVHNDPFEGVYVIATGDAIGGANGAIVRVVGSDHEASWWGIAASASAPYNAAAFNSMTALDEVKSANLPAGNINYTNIFIERGGLRLRGQKSATVLVQSASTGNGLTIGTGASEIFDLHLRDFDMWALSQKTAGWAIYAQKLVRSSIIGVDPSSLTRYSSNGNASNQYGGIWFDGYDRVVFDGEIWGCNDNLKANGLAGQVFGAELTIAVDAALGKALNYNLHIAGSANVYCYCEISQGLTGVRIDKAESGEYNREVFIDNEIDAATGSGLHVAADSLAILKIPTLWLASCGTVANNLPAMQIDPCTTVFPQIIATGMLAYNNVNSAVVINACDTANFSGAEFSGNGTGANGGIDLWLPNAGANRVVAAGAKFLRSGNATLGEALRIAAPVTNFAFTGCVFSGSGTQPVNNAAGLSKDKIIRNCVGYTTDNGSYSTLLSGTTTLVVNHGCNAAPGRISISFAGPQDAGAHAYVAPGSITATQFTITYSVSAGANRSFSWTAHHPGF